MAKKALLVGALVLIAAAIALAIYIQTVRPQYEGRISSEKLRSTVEVFFDPYGVPHIYGQHEEDVYFTFGYVHAQERLWQMDLLRRVASGRLAEILGPDLVETDRFFRTLGIHRASKISATEFLSDDELPYQRAAIAYLAGVNEFIDKGFTPLEYQILGIPKQTFSREDIYNAVGFMGFSFAWGYRTDPIVSRIASLGAKYLEDLDVEGNPASVRIPTTHLADARIAAHLIKIQEYLPVPVWEGSNSWVIGPGKTKSGKVILANDTHMQYSQPCAWYEAHLEAPGLGFYGNYVAGFPFTVAGHNRFAAVGVTMSEMDDMDLFIEKYDPEDSNRVWVNDHWEPLSIHEEEIDVKDGDPVTIKVKLSRHGPIVNQVIDNLGTRRPVSLFWTFNKFPSRALEAAYSLVHGTSMDEYREAVAKIHAPGFNIMYGDRDGNIAWWTTGKLVVRPTHVRSKTLLDGSSGRDEYEGYLTADQNPQLENPPWQFVYSANNQPDSISGKLYPGYYLPEDRALRITGLLEEPGLWDVARIRSMITDVVNPVQVHISQSILEVLESSLSPEQIHKYQNLLRTWKDWDGQNDINDTAPVIFNKVLFRIVEGAFQDELGKKDFESFLRTHLFKRSIAMVIDNSTSIWWDDIGTNEAETRNQIIVSSFLQTMVELQAELDQGITWGDVHQIEHPHAFGRKPPLDQVFNVGPFPIKGSNETINNTMFTLTGSGHYTARAGPAMRRIIDFDDIENSLSVLPTGQSGNLLSPHYSDQVELYNLGGFRKQMMNREEIENSSSRLLFEPVTQ